MKTSALLKSDYSPFYHGYIAVLGEAELMPVMRNQRENFPRFIDSIADDKWQYAYAEEKWTIAEVLQHVIDAERVFQYRALRIARGDQTALPGFDQDAYVTESGAGQRTREDIREEYMAVRQSSILLFSGLDEEKLRRTGTASNFPISVGALGFIICGHQKHHRNILRERYL